MRTITADQLVDRRVCDHFLNLFRQLFGNSVEVTHELAEKHFNTFPITWLGNYMLSLKSRTAFDYVLYHATQELNKATNEIYVKMILEATTPEKAKWADYERISKPHSDKFCKTLAHAFVDLYNQDTQ